MSERIIENKNVLRVDFLDDFLHVRATNREMVLDHYLVERMLNNILIATPVQALVRSIKRKTWEVVTKDESLKERFKKIECFDEMVESILEAMFYGYTVNEIMYRDDFTIKKLEEVPRDLLDYDYLNDRLRVVTEGELPLALPKFLVTYHRRNAKFYLGRSLLRPLVAPFLEYEDIDNKIRAIQQKYGSIIPVFGYDKKLGDTPEGIESIKKQAQGLKSLSDGSVLAVPLMEGHTLKDGFQYVSLSDLKIDIHLSLRDKLESKVIRHLLGSTLTMDMINGGSFALGEIHAKEKEKAEMEMTEFVKDELIRLLRVDNFLFGSDEEATLIYREKLNETEQFKLNATIADLRTKTMSVILNLQNAGYKLSKSRISRILDIPEEDLLEYTPPKEGE